MKKRMLMYGCLLLFPMWFSSCSFFNKPEDIKLSDLQTVCDFVNAREKIVTAILEIEGNKLFKPSEYAAEKGRIVRLKSKLGDIKEVFSKKYTKIEAKDCDSWHQLVSKEEQLKRITKSEDIMIYDLKTVCDHVDAIEIIFNEAISLTNAPRQFGRQYWYNAMSKAGKDKLKMLKDKLEDVSESLKDKYNKKEMKECENFEKIVQMSKDDIDEIFSKVKD